MLELSSYQLELTEQLACSVALILNVSPDHLDRHGGMTGYIRAKRRILRNQGGSDWAIIGVDDDHGQALVAKLRGERRRQVLPISSTARLEHGVYVEAGRLYDAMDGPAREVADLRPIATLQGVHNWQNAAAAYAAARIVGVPPETAAAGMMHFGGLPHRMELVATIEGVRFVNDSKATNPDAAARALACFERIFWIAGGRPKQGGLDAVLPYLERVRHAFLIGEATAQFADILRGRVPLTCSGDLATALHEAAAAAAREAGSAPVVLLAPACASFDQFADFEARGAAFKSLAAALAEPPPLARAC